MSRGLVDAVSTGLLRNTVKHLSNTKPFKFIWLSFILCTIPSGRSPWLPLVDVVNRLSVLSTVHSNEIELSELRRVTQAQMTDFAIAPPHAKYMLGRKTESI
jgi:hypothetical protein